MLRSPASVDREKRSKDNRMVQKVWGRALENMSLPAEKLGRMKELLVERWESMQDAHDISVATGATKNSQLKGAIDRVNADWDADLRKAVDSDEYAKIRTMVDAVTYFSTVETVYAAEFAFHGAPLAPSQVWPFATALYEIYDSKANPQAARMRIEAIDAATGLSALDRQALVRVTPILTSAQIEFLKVKLRTNTMRASQAAIKGR